MWGRNRLPATDSDWSQQFTVNLLSADEKALPIAHTCFFSIDLPPYQSAETLRAKLLYAIYNCTVTHLPDRWKCSAVKCVSSLFPVVVVSLVRAYCAMSTCPGYR